MFTTARVHSLSEIGNTFPLAGLAEPRIEPEIVFRLAVAPTLGMDERTLLESIDWVAHGFEIVLSIFPGWKFSAPDAVAAFGLHGAPPNWAPSCTSGVRRRDMDDRTDGCRA
jgi:2-oxo-3-hexenedioate decarboxylase